jgi:hypothetical protein
MGAVLEGPACNVLFAGTVGSPSWQPHIIPKEPT